MIRCPLASRLRTLLVTAALVALVFLPGAGRADGPPPFSASSVSVWLTARDTGDRLASKAPVPFAALEQPEEHAPTVIVDPSKPFQTIEGFGGALTDASAETWAKLPAERQQELLTAYFDPEQGIGYSLCRTHIHSCDFSSESYAYTEVPGDVTLQHFSLDHDRRHKLPFIRAALRTAGGPVKIFASPWSPPAWMKTNGNMLQGGQLKPEYRRGVGALLRPLRAGVREGGRPDLGPHGAERADGHPDLGVLHLHGRRGAGLRARLPRPGARGRGPRRGSS